MTIRTLTTFSLVAAIAVCVPVALSAQAAANQGQAKPEQKPEAKPDAKADASIAGKWNANVETPNGPQPVTLDIKIEGKKVTGTIASQMGETAITGEFAEGKLTFSTTIDANGQQMTVPFSGVLQKDGSFSGTLTFAENSMPWTATKAKG